MRTRRIGIGLLGFVLLSLLGCSRSADCPDLYDTLLDPGLPARLTAAQQPDFLTDLPKISTHEHYRAGGSFELYRKVAVTMGIQKVVLLPTGDAPDNRGYREHMASLLETAKRYPDFVIPFATVNPPDPDAVEVLADAVHNGARGLKLLSGHPDFYKAPLDGPPMMAVFEEARKLGIPVLIHISPERLPKQMPEFEHLLQAFPTLTVIAAHYARTPPVFDETARLLDTYPNLYMDISMGGGLSRYQGEIPRFLHGYRDFVLSYQDRLMWGTDMVLDAETTEPFIRTRIETDFLLLGTRLYVDPQAGHDKNAIEFGLDLPRPVLAKIFYDNPKRILGIR